MIILFPAFLRYQIVVFDVLNNSSISEKSSNVLRVIRKRRRREREPEKIENEEEEREREEDNGHYTANEKGWKLRPSAL